MSNIRLHESVRGSLIVKLFLGTRFNFYFASSSPQLPTVFPSSPDIEINGSIQDTIPMDSQLHRRTMVFFLLRPMYALLVFRMSLKRSCDPFAFLPTVVYSMQLRPATYPLGFSLPFEMSDVPSPHQTLSHRPRGQCVRKYPRLFDEYERARTRGWPEIPPLPFPFPLPHPLYEQWPTTS